MERKALGTGKEVATVKDVNQAFRIPSEVFIEKLQTINVDNDRSLEEFEEFLFQNEFSPLMLGTTEMGQTLHFEPGKDILYPQMWRLPSNDKESRYPVSDIVLGVWFTSDERFAGKEDDECIFVMDDIVPQLEVFLQLGAILIAETEHQGYQDWKPSRYELVVNLEDESLWVLRKPFISILDAVNKNFASEKTTEVKWNSLDEPGGIKDERVVFGRLGFWNSLFNKKSPTSPNLLSLTHVHSKRPGHDDPVISIARRTEFGGIRRTNDFAFKGKKYSMCEKTVYI